MNFPACRAGCTKDACHAGSAASTAFSVSAAQSGGRYLVFREKLPKAAPSPAERGIFWQAAPRSPVVRQPCNKAMNWRGPFSLLGPICRVRYKDGKPFLGEPS